MTLVVVPGIGGSGPEHWQSLWQASYDGRRIAPASWDEPVAEDWLRALLVAIGPEDVAVAHSLGCLALASWLAGGGRCAGALLVAVPDPTGPEFPRQAQGFVPVREPLGVPAIVVASTDDPYGSVPYAATLTTAWGARLVVAGAHGHLNAASGLGDWAAGRALLDELT